MFGADPWPNAQKAAMLAVTGAARSEVLPDLPTVADFLPGYEATSWYGLGAPKGTPGEVVEKLNREVNAILADPKTRVRFLEMGASLLPGTAAQFGSAQPSKGGVGFPRNSASLPVRRMTRELPPSAGCVAPRAAHAPCESSRPRSRARSPRRSRR
jgi:hypothetical protein